MLSCVLKVFSFVALASIIFASSANSASNSKQLIEYGKSNPPIGYVQFCARGQEECQTKGGKLERITFTDEVWSKINQVNTIVNSSVKAASDTDIYSVTDYWTYPKTTGDCEDYALLKKKLLVELGFKPDELLMTVVFDENGEGHAILTVMTSDADFILDNRREEILPPNLTKYKFLKRQSQLDPKLWVSLRKTDAQVLVSSQSQ